MTTSSSTSVKPLKRGFVVVGILVLPPRNEFLILVVVQRQPHCLGQLAAACTRYTRQVTGVRTENKFSTGSGRPNSSAHFQDIRLPGSPSPVPVPTLALRPGANK